MNEHYIVESLSRGVVMEELPNGKFRCSYVAKRTEGLRLSFLEAQKICKLIPKSYILRVVTHPKLHITHI